MHDHPDPDYMKWKERDALEMQRFNDEPLDEQKKLINQMIRVNQQIMKEDEAN